MTGEKHILILSSWYPSKRNPFLGNFVQRQAKLIAEIHKVTVLTLTATKDKNELPCDKTEGNFREITVPFVTTKNTLLRKYRHLKAFKKGLKMISDVTHIHGHIIIPDGLNFVVAKKYFDCPLIVTEHSSLYFFKEKLEQKKIFVLNKTLKQVDKLVAVSEILKDNLALKAPQHKIKVIPNHIDTLLFQPKTKIPSEKFKFLHISTLAPIKNVHEILQAFELAYAINKLIELTILSDEDSTELKALTNQLASKENIRFEGPVLWKETLNYYQNADCFVLHSSHESFSIVLAEAWSCGIPVISTNVGIAHNLPAYLGIQTKQSVASLSDAMLHMVQSANEFDANKLHSFAKQFDRDEVLKQLTALYD